MIKLSRSTVERYINCPRCCFLEKKHNIRYPSLPFTLNIAVDNLCKNEFDFYRTRAEPHPIFIEHGLDAIPFAHPKMNEWRNNLKGLRYISKQNGYDFGGALDDIWLKSNGQLIVADVKCTAKKNFNWSETFSKYNYAKGYKRQLEMYQWLLKKNGFAVADEAYIVYFNGRKNDQFFKQQLKFDLHLIKLDCNTEWVEQKILEVIKVLNSNQVPPAFNSCEYCSYLKKRWHLSRQRNK
tara:strand:+ start:2638 stop:3351 length:714 start_codon:yes stop_codon:yes gene_type:complete